MAKYDDVNYALFSKIRIEMKTEQNGFGLGHLVVERFKDQNWNSLLVPILLNFLKPREEFKTSSKESVTLFGNITVRSPALVRAVIF